MDSLTSMARDEAAPTTLCILGGSGFVGRRLIRQISGIRGGSLRVLRHRRDPGLLPGIETIDGSADDPDVLEQLLRPGAVVINLVNFGDDIEVAGRAARALADACAKARILRLVHVSTAVVVGDSASSVIDEKTPCDPATAYELAKFEVERLLMEKARDAFELVILRPTAVFGPGGRNLLAMADRLRSGGRLRRYVVACLMGRRRMNLVDVDAVVAAVRFLAAFPGKLNNRLFIVSDDDEPMNNYFDLEEQLARRLDVPGHALPVVPLPPWALRLLLRLARRPSRDPQRRYMSGELQELGFEKPRTFLAALDEFAACLNEGRA